MPFQTGAGYGPLQFASAVLDTVIETGGVYGLFQYNPFSQKYVCLYVGMSDNLRRRLREHFNNPPISGTTHFFVEGHATVWARTEREAVLIREFNPFGNTVGKR